MKVTELLEAQKKDTVPTGTHKQVSNWLQKNGFEKEYMLPASLRAGNHSIPHEMSSLKEYKRLLTILQSTSDWKDITPENMKTIAQEEGIVQSMFKRDGVTIRFGQSLQNAGPKKQVKVWHLKVG